MTARLRQLTSLSGAQLVILAQATVALRLAPPLLRRRGLQGLQAKLAGNHTSAAPSGGAARTAAEVARLVAVAANHGPAKPNCLARSVVLWWLLQRRGIASEVRIGVRRSRSGSGMDFHAWVERDGAVLNDAPDIRTHFATFDRAIVPPHAEFA